MIPKDNVHCPLQPLSSSIPWGVWPGVQSLDHKSKGYSGLGLIKHWSAKAGKDDTVSSSAAPAGAGHAMRSDEPLQRHLHYSLRPSLHPSEISLRSRANRYTDVPPAAVYKFSLILTAITSDNKEWVPNSKNCSPPGQNIWFKKFVTSIL